MNGSLRLVTDPALKMACREEPYDKVNEQVSHCVLIQ
jgi:hypothetical protein